MNYYVTSCCGKIIFIDESKLSNNELGISYACIDCNSSCNVDLLDSMLIENGTIVTVHDDWLGEIVDNDSRDTDDFANVNYYVKATDGTLHYEWCLASDLQINKESVL